MQAWESLKLLKKKSSIDELKSTVKTMPMANRNNKVVEYLISKAYNLGYDDGYKNKADDISDRAQLNAQFPF